MNKLILLVCVLFLTACGSDTSQSLESPDWESPSNSVIKSTQSQEEALMTIACFPNTRTVSFDLTDVVNMDSQEYVWLGFYSFTTNIADIDNAFMFIERDYAALEENTRNDFIEALLNYEGSTLIITVTNRDQSESFTLMYEISNLLTLYESVCNDS